MNAYQKYIEEQSKKWQCTGCNLYNEKKVAKCISCEKDRFESKSNSAVKPSVFPQATPNPFSSRTAKPLQTKPVKKKKDTKTMLAELFGKLTGGKTALLVFGSNSFGSLGLGERSASIIKIPTVVPESIRRNFREVHCGAFCMAAIDENGDLWTWGPNDGGILGRDTSKKSSLELSPGKVTFPKAAKGKTLKVSVGDEHMAAVLTDGNLYSWGTFKSLSGRVGHHVDGNGKIIEIQKTPVKIELPTDEKVVDIASGSNHVAVLVESGKVFILGISNFSMKTNLRRDTPSNSLKIHKLYCKPNNHKMIEMKSIFCGTHTIYAIDSFKKLYSCGLNNFGQLGNSKPIKEGNRFNHSRSLQVVSLGSDGNKKKVKKVGLGKRKINELESGLVLGKKFGAVKVCAGNHHAIVVTEDQEIYSFGRNASGILGVKTAKGPKEFSGVVPEQLPSSKPLNVQLKATDLAVGSDHNLIVKPDGSLVGFGYNSDFRLGLGNEDEISPGKFSQILSVEDLNKRMKIVGISAGSQFSCVLVERVVKRLVKKKLK